MQIKKGKKKHTGDHFLVTKKNTRGEELRKKQREKVEKKRRLILLSVLLSTN